MTDLPVLYSFRRCPYAMRARMALAVSGTVVELREVALGAKPAELIAASPKATVPVLVTANGQVIEQSLDVMRWALARNDPRGWLSGGDAAVADALIAANDGPFKQHLDRYKYAGRYEGADPLGHRAAALAILAELELRLSAAAYLNGGVPTLADIAIFPFVRQFAAADQGWFDAQPLPLLRRWLDGFLASELFASVMQRWKPWVAGDAPALFPGILHPSGVRIFTAEATEGAERKSEDEGFSSA